MGDTQGKYIYVSNSEKHMYRVSLLGSKAHLGVLSGVERRRESREERDCLALSERSKKNSGERGKKRKIVNNRGTNTNLY